MPPRKKNQRTQVEGGTERKGRPKARGAEKNKKKTIDNKRKGRLIDVKLLGQILREQGRPTTTPRARMRLEKEKPRLTCIRSSGGERSRTSRKGGKNERKKRKDVTGPRAPL